MNTEQRINDRASSAQNYGLKLGMIAIIVILLLIPIFWIDQLVDERYYRKEGVITEIASKWGDAQMVSGPFISVPYYVQNSGFDPSPSSNSDREANISTAKQSMIKRHTQYLHFAADQLNISGTINSVKHKRGIFKVPGYKADLIFEADFAAARIDNPVYAELPLRWDEATISFILNDQYGLRSIDGTVNEAGLVFFKPSDGVVSVSSILDGSTDSMRRPYMQKRDNGTDLHLVAPVPVDFETSDMSVLIKLHLSGTQKLWFAVSALNQSIGVEGDWASPSFIGDLLPDSRSIDSQGFKASWETNKLNSGINKIWSSQDPNPRLLIQGIDFLIVADSYQQTTRSLKYSVLFLILTFMTFFFAEVLAKQRIHPIQYCMVGCGLVLFYLLLLSISEHIDFGWAYLIASIGVIMQICLYCFSILKTKRFALQIGSLLIVLYTLLYVLLRLKETALLVGSIGLFVLLSAAMYAVRNVNWYKKE